MVPVKRRQLYLLMRAATQIRFYVTVKSHHMFSLNYEISPENLKKHIRCLQKVVKTLSGNLKLDGKELEGENGLGIFVLV